MLSARESGWILFRLVMLTEKLPFTGFPLSSFIEIFNDTFSLFPYVGRSGVICHWGILHLTSIIVYGVSMILLYLASTLYHSFSFCSQKVQSVFKCIDHSAIYLLIAGNYTPFALIALYGTLGWAVFGVVWGLALAGIVFQIFFYNRFRVIGTICYLVMGWLAVTIVNPLLDTLSVEAIWWLVAGGVLYSIGAIFYLIRKIPYNHVIWHVFVILGSAAHFITIYCYVLPLSID